MYKVHTPASDPLLGSVKQNAATLSAVASCEKINKEKSKWYHGQYYLKHEKILKMRPIYQWKYKAFVHLCKWKEQHHHYLLMVSTFLFAPKWKTSIRKS